MRDPSTGRAPTGPTASTPPAPEHHGDDHHLQRNLTNRHIQLIAIGGAIGTGLFMGSGKTIHVAGPSLLLVYVAIGTVLYFVMRAMGELLLHNLEYKSFQDFAADLLGPFAGFLAGWTYWFLWVVTGMAEMIAVVGYFEFWTHDRTTAMLCGAAMLLLLLGLNLLTVALFGEMEFWFALVKVIAILALISIGAYLMITGFRSPSGTVAGLGHLWDHGGFFPRGIEGFFAAFQIAVFAFVGIELVGTTAAETKDPTVTLPRAINAIPLRIVFFYVFALVAIMSVTPWDEVDPLTSPFVNMFGLVGFAAAAAVMNFVVLTSASSSCNSGIFSTSRMLFGLAGRGHAPAAFKRLSSHNVPAQGLFFSVGLIFLAFPILMFGGTIMQAFTMVTTVAALLVISVWVLILLSYLAYRRTYPEAHAVSAYKMPLPTVMPIVCLAFFAFILVLLTFERDTLIAMAVTPVWFLVLGLAWRRRRRVLAGDEATAGESAAAGR